MTVFRNTSKYKPGGDRVTPPAVRNYQLGNRKLRDMTNGELIDIINDLERQVYVLDYLRRKAK